MQGRDEKKKDRESGLEPLGDLELSQVKPNKLVIGGGEREVKFYANGLFEENDDGDISPKRDLEAGVMTEDGYEIDELILVEKFSTDDFDYEDCFVRVKLTVPVEASIKEGCRKVFIKHKNENLDDDGECDSPTCDVLEKGVILLKPGTIT
jgi:hypothetical protein